MANESLKRMLELGKKVDSISSAPNKTINRNQNVSLDEQVKLIDEQVYGKYVPSKEEKKPYDAKAEWDRIAARETNGGDYNQNTRVPGKILESILKNPCNLDMELYEDQNMAALTKRLSGRMPGVKNVQELQKKLDEADKEKQTFTESLNPKSTTVEQASVGVDYSLIKSIVSDVLDEKFSSMKNELLIEGKKHEDNKLNVMAMGEKFLFLDDNDNVYECQMKYIGKNKRKNKK